MEEVLKYLAEAPQELKSFKPVIPNRITNLPKRHENCGFSNYKIIKPEFESKVNILRNFKAGDSITLIGTPGTGKTHLAIAIMKNYPMVLKSEKEEMRCLRELQLVIEHDPSDINKQNAKKQIESEIYRYRPATCLFLPIVEMVQELNDAALNGKKLEKFEEYNKHDVLCIDDLGSEKFTDTIQQNLFFILDQRYRNMKSTIITSNFTKDKLQKEDPRIYSRLTEMGLFVEFIADDYRTVINQNMVKNLK